MELLEVVTDIADALKSIDSTLAAFKDFQPGVGPYGEPQLVKLVAEHLNGSPSYVQGVKTKRTPDLLIAGFWAIETVATPACWATALNSGLILAGSGKQ